MPLSASNMQVEPTALPGLLKIHLDVFPDERGSFREFWQQEKMAPAGLPELKIVQANVAVSKRGATRGIHAEPWEKLVHVVAGSGFAAVVDLREDSPSFGRYEGVSLDEETALFIPRGFGNSFQATSAQATYVYLVSDYWRPGLTYPAIALDDPDLSIAWPVPEEERIISDKDRHNPSLRQLFPNRFPS